MPLPSSTSAAYFLFCFFLLRRFFAAYDFGRVPHTRCAPPRPSAWRGAAVAGGGAEAKLDTGTGQSASAVGSRQSVSCRVASRISSSAFRRFVVTTHVVSSHLAVGTWHLAIDTTGTRLAACLSDCECECSALVFGSQGARSTYVLFPRFVNRVAD